MFVSFWFFVLGFVAFRCVFARFGGLVVLGGLVVFRL